MASWLFEGIPFQENSKWQIPESVTKCLSQTDNEAKTPILSPQIIKNADTITANKEGYLFKNKVLIFEAIGKEKMAIICW
jgi:hypothetical protein